LSEAQTAEIAAAKRVVYDGFLSALAAGAPKDKAGILVDEQFGAAILRDAVAAGIVTACSAEKSGQEEFDFEYGEDFAKHIDGLHAAFCKDLVTAWVTWLAGAKAKGGNRITLLRYTNGDSIPEVRTTFLDHLNSPFGPNG